MMGDTEALPSYTRKAMEEAVSRTQGNTGLILNFALNYGGRKEIEDCMRSIGKDIQSGTLSPDDITTDLIDSRMLSGGLPDPDLLIRTSGEMRLSNFMLWQLAYSELWFTDVYWPEFDKEHLHQAIAEYQRRTRRYGGLK
jgi:undecaprenyl diphosphate synthase